jgi:hypothetical protein
MAITSFSLFLSLLIVVAATATNSREQFAAVKGKLMCGAKPVENVGVRLYDQDIGRVISD